MSTATSQRDEHIDLKVSQDLTEHESLTLTRRDWEAFLAALDDADRPRPRLAAAVRRLRSRLIHPVPAGPVGSPSRKPPPERRDEGPVGPV